MFLKMLTGTRADEDESYDNIIICISVSTVLMVFTSIMEALTYFLYSNKVDTTIALKDLICFQFHPRSEIIMESKKKNPKNKGEHH